MSKSPLFYGLMALAVIAMAAPLQAMPRLGRDHIGIVRDIDLVGGWMTMQAEAGSGMLSFTWNRRTVFGKGDSIVKASAIRSGDAVQVRFHRPLFGHPFITRMRVISAVPVAIQRAPRSDG